ncbi:uncharacterized protein BDW43DRAFT_316341 [Aspergillus alliaceus]|uniref:uncharacterized protein n=1 Tax=Petromyces alliaceus TaxID=209559 RepID=UPI0012A3C170|nr:uncharacterized protein BDW43DRAFT_316341 [Aspergillus alliaceus]KAB8227930.1 hypothetical protein BDW43DRAFT_316341 [Aspergillus alliaceus]
MLTERDAQIDAEQASGQCLFWREVYQMMRCPGPPCRHEGQYCWLDPVGKKHYKLRTHHLRGLVKYIEGGGILDTHDDLLTTSVNSSIQGRHNALKNTKRSSQILSDKPIAAEQLSSSPDCIDTVDIPGFLDDAVEEYANWHLSRVSRELYRDHIKKARDVALENGFDLKQISGENPDFFVKQGVVIGVARRFVSDIQNWINQCGVVQKQAKCWPAIHGYGIIFYLFVVPSSLYEKYLTKTGDVDIVISHFLKVGLSIDNNAKLAGEGIVKSVTGRFKEQVLTLVNIYRTLPVDSGSSKRKRRTPKAPRKRAARNIPDLYEKHPDKNTAILNTGSQTTLSEAYETEQMPGIANEVPDNTAVSSLMGPTQQETQLTFFASPEATRQSLSETQVVSGPVQHTTMLVNLDSINAAHLMQNFDMISFANAAELMQNFDVTSFDPLTAAQLMPSFDLFPPLPDIRYRDNQT